MPRLTWLLRPGAGRGAAAGVRPGSCRSSGSGLGPRPAACSALSRSRSHASRSARSRSAADWGPAKEGKKTNVKNQGSGDYFWCCKDSPGSHSSQFFFAGSCFFTLFILPPLKREGGKTRKREINKEIKECPHPNFFGWKAADWIWMLLIWPAIPNLFHNSYFDIFLN